ncbi:MFS transporter [Limosilactobacillus walteri]|uniref:MFS transporter n=1 Tax=Limosilactobacillus walteri TaxID=2268022 RepID=UPI00177EBA91|nr:MFS transporter [Limosilactobacillus walteri]
MNSDNNSSLIIPICSALNALFVIGLVAMDKYWDYLSSWIVYPYILLMVINGVILLVYAVKNNKK